MSASGLSAVWAPPSPEAPPLQLEVHRHLMCLVDRIGQRDPSIFTEPQSVGGKWIMESALGQVMEMEIAQPMRAAVLERLQLIVRSFPNSDAPRRVFLPAPPQKLPLDDDFGQQLASLEMVKTSVHDYLIRAQPFRPAAPQGEKVGEPRLTPVQIAGMLLTLLIIRRGICDSYLLGIVLESIEQPLIVAGRWAWVDVEIPESVRSVRQLRRLHLDPVTAAAWMKASDLKETAALKKSTPKPVDQRKRIRVLAQSAVNAFLRVVESEGSEGWLGLRPSLKALCQWQANWLRVHTMPLIASFATGEIPSSSLDIDTWLRLLGHQLPPSTIDYERENVKGVEFSGDPSSMEKIDRQIGISAQPSLAEANDHVEMIARGDLETEGVLVKLRQIMREPRAAWAEGLRVLLAEIERERSPQAVAAHLVAWLLFLCNERSSKTKLLSDGTILYQRGILANRLLAYLPESLVSIDSDELAEHYLEIIEDGSATKLGGRIAGALSSFHRVVRSRDADIPPVPLKGFSAGSYQISNRIVSEVEFRRIWETAGDGTFANLEPRVEKEVRAFLALAFRLGLRRGEILGLQVRDFHRSSDGTLVIRENESRSLKTTNARRCIPVGILEAMERATIRDMCVGRSPSDYVFFASEEVPARAKLAAHPAIGLVNQILAHVTGDKRLHPHNLRHSAATLGLLGMLGSDVGIDRHPQAETWMRTAQNRAEHMAAGIAGTLKGKMARGAALAMMMGHGSEMTTYAHYVHSLDLLLYFAISQEKDEVPGQATRAKDGEAALLLTMLGLPAWKRLDRKDFAGLMLRIAESNPLRARVGTPLLTELRHATRITLAMLRDGSSKTERGWPERPAATRTALATLKLLDTWQARNSDLASKLVGMLVKKLLNKDDWSSLALEEAIELHKWLVQLDGTDRVDWQHVFMPRGTRKTIKQPMACFDPNLVQIQPTGKYWCRIARSNKGAAKTDLRRTQSSVTWTVKRWWRVNALRSS